MMNQDESVKCNKYSLLPMLQLNNTCTFKSKIQAVTHISPQRIRRAKLKRVEAAPNGTFQVNGVQCRTNGKAARRILEY